MTPSKCTHSSSISAAVAGIPLVLLAQNDKATCSITPDHSAQSAWESRARKHEASEDLYCLASDSLVLSFLFTHPSPMLDSLSWAE